MTWVEGTCQTQKSLPLRPTFRKGGFPRGEPLRVACPVLYILKDCFVFKLGKSCPDKPWEISCEMLKQPFFPKLWNSIEGNVWRIKAERVNMVKKKKKKRSEYITSVVFLKKSSPFQRKRKISSLLRNVIWPIESIDTKDWGLDSRLHYNCRILVRLNPSKIHV